MSGLFFILGSLLINYFLFMKNKPLHIDSYCVQQPKNHLHVRPHQLPIYATSSFQFDSIEQGMAIFSGKEEGYIYGRLSNPTMDVVAQKIADLETFGLDFSAKGILVSSGMSAISTLAISLLQAGDKILTQNDLYGGTTEFFVKVLAQFGIKTIAANLRDLEEAEYLLKKDATIKMMYLETPANPAMACVDIEKLSLFSSKT